MPSIDLNGDLGESFGPWPMGDDKAMLSIITSANIACGFHAGDPANILAVLREASRRGISIGAHIGYRDLVGFGRRNMDLSNAELTADTIYQIGALQGLAQAAGTAVRYVKPHGALYSTMASDARQAASVIAGIRAIDPSLILVTLAGAPVIEQARAAGLTVVTEVFADRAYNANGTLVSRRLSGSVIHDRAIIADRMFRLVSQGRITAVDGSEITIDAGSIRVYGDNPEAVERARTVRQALIGRGVVLETFAPARRRHA